MDMLKLLGAAVAEPSAKPKPLFDLPEPHPTHDQAGSSYISDIGYMVMGTVLGIISTLVYYNCARLRQRLLTQQRDG